MICKKNGTSWESDSQEHDIIYMKWSVHIGLMCHLKIGTTKEKKVTEDDGCKSAIEGRVHVLWKRADEAGTDIQTPMR